MDSWKSSWKPNDLTALKSGHVPTICCSMKISEAFFSFVARPKSPMRKWSSDSRKRFLKKAGNLRNKKNNMRWYRLFLYIIICIYLLSFGREKMREVKQMCIVGTSDFLVTSQLPEDCPNRKRECINDKGKSCVHTVDRRNLAPPDMYETL